MFSAQALLPFSSLFFNPYRMVQLITLASLFVQGQEIDVNLCFIFNSSHIFLNFLSSNYFLFSITKILGQLKLQIMFFQRKSIAFWSIIVANGSVLTYLVKQSTLAIKNLFCLTANWKDPKMSIPYWRKGHREFNVLSSEASA